MSLSLSSLFRFNPLPTPSDRRRDGRGASLTHRASHLFGLRMRYKSPAFTVVAVMTLALGISANAVVFSVLNGLMAMLLLACSPLGFQRNAR